jgi:uncharacterized repeat protein (TIGR02543 family)
MKQYKRSILLFALTILVFGTLFTVSANMSLGDSDITIPSYHSELIEVDIDLDGDMDLVGNSATEFFLLTFENGGFTKSTIYGTGSSGYRGSNAVVTDMNEDGYPDLLIGIRSYTGSIMYLENDTQGGFDAGTPLLDADYIYTLAYDDVNNDDLKDIIYSTSGSVYVAYQDENGDYAVIEGQYGPEPFAWGYNSGVSNIYVEDLDQDDDQDILLVTYSSSDVNVRVLYNNANDQTFTKVDLYNSSNDIVGEFIDIDNDTIKELIIADDTVIKRIDFNANQTITEVEFFDVSSATDIPTTRISSISGITLNDMNMDGLLDIVIGTRGDYAAYIFYQDSLGFGYDNADYAFLRDLEAYKINVFDVDLDGAADVVVSDTTYTLQTSFNKANHYTVSLDTQGGVPLAPLGISGTEFYRPSDFYSYSDNGYGVSDSKNGETASIELDYDQDGDQDLLYIANTWTTSRVQVVQYFENTSTPLGSISFTENEIIGDGTQFSDTNIKVLEYGDFDNDGSITFIAYDDANGKIIRFGMDGSYDLTSYSNDLLPGVNDEISDMAVADLNDDGYDDFVYTDLYNDEIYYVQNYDSYFGDPGSGYIYSTALNHDGTFTNPQTITASDLNQDGFMDFVVSESNSSGKVYQLINNGSNVFTVSEVSSTVGIYMNIDVDDIDGDTYPDIVAYNRGIISNDSHVYVYLNDTNGGFNAAIEPTDQDFTAYGTTLVKSFHDGELEDLDSDGDLDLIVYNDFNSKLPSLWYEYENGSYIAFKQIHSTYDSSDYAILNTNSSDFNGDGYVDILSAIATNQNSSIKYELNIFESIEKETRVYISNVIPVKQGNLFNGWFIDSEGSIPYINQVLNGDTTLYASWTPLVYKVIYEDYDGTILFEQEFDPGDDLTGITPPSHPDRAGYLPAGWSQTLPQTMPSEMVVLEAQYTPIDFTISFDTNGGSSISNIVQGYETSVIAPTDPTKTGYTFGGWYTESTLENAFTFDTMPLNGVTLFAKWDVITYDVESYALLESNTSLFTLEPGEEISFIYVNFQVNYIATTHGRVFASGSRYLLGKGEPYANFDSTLENITNNFNLNEGEFIVNIVEQSGNVFFYTSQDRLLITGSNYSDLFSIGSGNSYSTIVDATSDYLDPGQSILMMQVTYDSFVYQTDDFVVHTVEHAEDSGSMSRIKNINLNPGEYFIDLEWDLLQYVALTSEGRVFVWQTFYASTLSLPTTPTQLNLSLNTGEKVIDIEMNEDNVLMYTSKDRVIGFGEMSGRSYTNPIVEFAYITGGIDALDSQLVIYSDNYYWILGSNSEGEFGIGTTSSGSTSTTYVASSYIPLELGETIDSMKVNAGYTIIVTSSNRVLVVGSKYSSPLAGASGTKTLTYTTLVNSFIRLEDTTFEYDQTVPTSQFLEVDGLLADAFYTDFDLTQSYDLTSAPNSDLTIYGYYRAYVPFDFKIIGFDGEEIVSVVLEEGDDLSGYSLPTDTEKTGYTFNGFDVTIPATMPGSDLTITADYTVNQYTVTFKDEAGNVLQTDTFDYGDVVGYIFSGTLPNKDGHTFSTWDSTYASQSGAIYNIYMPAENIVYTPVFDINQYSITFKDHDGTTIQEYTVDYNSDLSGYSNPTDPSRTGWSFNGWDSSLPTTMPSNDVTITAQYSINQYSLSFFDHDGEIIRTETFDYGTDLSAYSIPSDPTREGYTFTDWDTLVPSSMPASAVNITAQYTVNQYSITYFSNGGGFIPGQTYDFGDTITLPNDPVSDGYLFDGWFTDETLTTEFSNTTMPAEDIQLFASYTQGIYKIEFLDDDDSLISTQEFAYQSDLSSVVFPQDPSKEGYTFDGWSMTLPATMPLGNITLKATYQINSYSLILRDDEGNIVYNGTFEYNENIDASLLPSNITREGYTFDGWATLLPQTMPSTDLDIDPTFSINTYVVTYDIDGELTTESVVYGESLQSVPTATRTGHSFVGWSITSGIIDTETYTQIASDVTMTAIFIDDIIPVIVTESQEFDIEIFDETFELPECIATDSADESPNCSVINTLNINELGTYIITYKATDSAGNEAADVLVTVNVIDTQKPQVTIDELEFTLEVNTDPFDMPSCLVTDNSLEDINCQFEGTVNDDELGTYIINVTATDSSGNTSDVMVLSVEVVDTTPPIIIANEELIMIHGTLYELIDKFSATDNYDSEVEATITESITILGPGIYDVNVAAVDASGNVTTETFSVTVLPSLTVVFIISILGGLGFIAAFFVGKRR